MINCISHFTFVSDVESCHCNNYLCNLSSFSFSFSQTRGSIPIYWSQIPTLKYKPNPCLSKNTMDQASGIQKHFDEQIVLYGQQTAINLINQSGSEKSLGDAFKHFVNSLSSVLIKYVHCKVYWVLLHLMVSVCLCLSVCVSVCL